MKQAQNARRNKPGRMNNQNNRNKGGKSQQNGRGQQPASMNKQVDSHGPAGKQRGTANQLYEKYKILSKDCYSSDRQLSESLAQYADHYYRIFAEFAAAEAATQVMREKEKARREQEEIERRANSTAAQDGGSEWNNAPADNAGPKQKNRGRSEGRKRPVEDTETSLPAFLENAIPQKTSAKTSAKTAQKPEQRTAENIPQKSSEKSSEKASRAGSQAKTSDQKTVKKAPKPIPSAKKENLTLDLDIPVPQKETITEAVPAQEEKPTPKRRGRPRKAPAKDDATTKVEAPKDL